MQENELIKLMANARGTIHFYVVPTGKNIDSYHFFISIIGQATDEKEGFLTITINEINKGSFENQVMPKLIKNFSVVVLGSQV